MPEDAEAKFYAVKTMVENFMRQKYRIVATPMVEFEDSLFSGSGEALKAKTLTAIDPVSQKTLGIRSDMTTQIARLVESRFADSDLPLRLCYYGDILRSTPANTNADRQLTQIGLELITKDKGAQSEAEVVKIAVEALTEIGIEDITIDLNTPKLVETLEPNLDVETKAILDKRDIANLPEPLAKLVEASGNAEKALEINTSNMNAEAKAQIDYLKELYEILGSQNINADFTIDYAEINGFEYHELISFSIFSKNIRDEIGRGGRYALSNFTGTGFTIYLNSILDKVKAG